MKNYEVIVGMEVHAELCTQTKLFCGCSTMFGADPNSQCCPVCAGMPGTLPVLNKNAVVFALRLGAALKCSINNLFDFARKSYFYPDLPKGYQITQYQHPICESGYLDILVGGQVRRIALQRIHLEEDAGKLLYAKNDEMVHVDYNRSGVPLVEIVTLPDIRGAEEARAFLQGIAGVLVCLGVSNGRMQEGSLRADVNVSVRKRGDTGFGVRTELKNMASFGAVERAVRAEAQRQIDLLGAGRVVQQETRRWDDRLKTSFVLRDKEGEPDYRYFPEPDLPAISIPDAVIRRAEENLPEMPLERTLRYMQIFALPEQDAVLLASSPERSDFFDAAVRCEECSPKTLANWMLGDVARELNARKADVRGTKLTPQFLAELAAMATQSTISGPAAKTLLGEVMDTGLSPVQLAEDKGLLQTFDEAGIQLVVQDVLAENAYVVADYKGGKQNALGYLVGACLKKSGAGGDPKQFRRCLLAEMGILDTTFSARE